jgi:O-antigen/teichoic acid export membrane protein
LIYGGAYLAGRLVNFLLLPLLAAVLVPQDFGAIDLTTAFASFALVTVALEIAQGLARSYPEATSDDERGRYSGSALAFALLAYGVFAIVALGAIALARPSVLNRPDGGAILAVGVAWVVASGILTITQVPLRFGLRPGAFAASNLSLAAASSVAVVVLVVGLRLGPAGVLASQTLGAAFAALVSWRLSRPRPVIRLDQQAIRRFLSFSLPLVPASVAIVATASMDRLAIASSLSLTDLGHYAVAVRVAAVVGLVVGAFQFAVTPLTYAFHRDPETRTALARMGRLYAAASVLLVGGLGWIGPELVRVMAGERYVAAIPVLPVVAAVPLLAGFGSLAPGLALLRSTRLMALIAILGAGLTTVLNFALVPRFGILAAGWSSAVATGAAMTLTVVYGQSRYRIPWDSLSLLAAVATVVAVGLIVPTLNANGFDALPVRTGLFIGVLSVTALAGVIRASDVRAVWATLRLHPSAELGS